MVELQVGVKVLLKNPEGKYLLIKRAPNAYPGVGIKWDIVGGRIEIATPLLDNLKREVMEETGLEMTSAPVLVAAQDIFKQSERHVVRLTYTGTAEGTPRLSEEHTEYLWLTLEEISKLDNLDSYFKQLLDGGIIS